MFNIKCKFSENFLFSPIFIKKIQFPMNYEFSVISDQFSVGAA